MKNIRQVVRIMKWPIVWACVIATFKIVFILTEPLRSLVMSPWLIDDSFIVMRVARNIALGHGFSFDGIHPTTGVSFLWTYITSIAHIVFNAEVAVKAALVLSTVLGGCSSLMVYLIAKQVSKNSQASWLAFAMISLLPVPFFNAMNGMETAAVTLFILLAIACLPELYTDNAPPTLISGFSCGSFLGLALLTRSDAIFFVASIVLYLAIQATFSEHRKHGSLRQGLGIAFSLGISACVLIVWQVLQTGSVLPDNQIGRHIIAVDKHHFDFAHFSLLPYIRIVIWNIAEMCALFSLSLTSVVLAIIGLLYGLGQKNLRSLAFITGTYIAMYCFVLVAYQWYFPDFHGLRYLNPGIHLLVILIACLLSSIRYETFATQASIAIVCSMIAISWYAYFDYGRAPTWSHGMTLFGSRSSADEQKFWAGIDWVKEHLPENAVVGMRDHGRFSYFTDHPVLDLAGILDPAVVQEWKKGNIGKYSGERSVSYFVLPPQTKGINNIYQSLHNSLHLSEVRDCPALDMSGTFKLYTID